MQRIWRSGIGWDDVLLERDYAKWVDYLDEVRKLSQLRIPRCYALRSSKIELHVFGDASEHAYAAVAYWRAVRPDGTVHLALVAGKSRVAPNKVMSIPRLELQAALLACRLATNIQKEHGIATERRVLWCDSKTVLRWIRSDPRAYKPFVAHRLAELDERSDRNEWRWVLLVDPPGAYVRPVLYFIRRLRKQQQPFGADDVIDAETRLLRASQRRAFSDEMRAAAVGAATPRKQSTGAGHGRDHAVRLLVEHYHRRAGHANHEAVVNIIRERFWITRLRPTVKKVANACRLPSSTRTAGHAEDGRPPGGRLAFVKGHLRTQGWTTGPLEVTVGRRREKRAALFTCLTTRAVHMEVASSLSADSMIMALRRFMARRGQPDTLYSDHGTNFVGAAQNSRARLEIEERMSDEATTRAIRWLRIPHTPRIWAEAGNAWSAAGRWQPGHFDTSEECSRKQWRASQALAEMFWQRWLREYPTLQRRHKWTEGRPPIKVGDAVVITDPALPRNTWPRGIVERVYPGIDGQVRVVDIRTAHGRLRRPTARLAVLPTEVESSHAPTGVDC
ncbi:hypothetical protein EVAR_46145_1 [Eumeta japonica]|uniref:Integrase catalytic domain-containing protein n=1 Tax=Eumeta variegata TaxID=151549 RepID=A0A4C2ACB6_EUMVA|nr:hypothetical protein EVAR_46145_1 [Eumeta japonica]